MQEEASCNRQPAPIRHPQPLSQGLSALPAPLFDRGRFCGNAGRHRTAGRARSDGRNHVPPVNPLLFRRRTGDGASSEKKPSPAADAGLGCSKNRPLRARTGGSGGHFAFGIKAPRRPFCPLSAGGKWTPFSAPAGAELPLRRTRGAPQSIRIANSLPQSPAATAPSSEGAKPAEGGLPIKKAALSA